MKRVYIAVAVLVLCLGFSLFSYGAIRNGCESFIESAENIQTCLKSEDYVRIEQQAKAIKALWKKESVPFSLLTTHYHYDAMEECADKLYHAAKARDKKEIRSCCEDLIFEAKHILTSIAPDWENIF